MWCSSGSGTLLLLQVAAHVFQPTHTGGIFPRMSRQCTGQKQSNTNRRRQRRCHPSFAPRPSASYQRPFLPPLKGCCPGTRLDHLVRLLVGHGQFYLRRESGCQRTFGVSGREGLPSRSRCKAEHVNGKGCQTTPSYLLLCLTFRRCVV